MWRLRILRVTFSMSYCSLRTEPPTTPVNTIQHY